MAVAFFSSYSMPVNSAPDLLASKWMLNTKDTMALSVALFWYFSAWRMVRVVPLLFLPGYCPRLKVSDDGENSAKV